VFSQQPYTIINGMVPFFITIFYEIITVYSRLVDIRVSKKKVMSLHFFVIKGI
jgi:hypothetical protein